MTSHKSKWTHAAYLALATFAADVGQQLASGTLSLTRAALLGVVVGGISRAIGAYLASRVEDEAEAEAAPAPQPPQ